MKLIIKNNNDIATINCEELDTNQIKIIYSASNLNDIQLVFHGWDVYIQDSNDNFTKIKVKNIIIHNKDYIVIEYNADAAERDGKGNIIITNGAEYKGVVPSVIDITEVDGCCLIIHNRKIKIDDEIYNLIDSFDNSDGKHVYRFMAERI